VAEVKQLEYWTTSNFKDYEKCPAMYKYRRLQKLPEPDSPAMARGTQIHTMAEMYVTGELSEVPDELKKLAEDFKLLKRLKPEMEKLWQFGKGWLQLLGAGKLWRRSKLDAVHIGKTEALVIDFKTGRVYPEHTDQFLHYAIDTLGRHPELKQVRTEGWYTDQGEVHDKTYSKEELVEERKKWTAKAEQFLEATEFRPTPGKACKWCAFSKTKGGPCHFG
jgi:hypothetical protein